MVKQFINVSHQKVEVFSNTAAKTSNVAVPDIVRIGNVHTDCA